MSPTASQAPSNAPPRPAPPPAWPMLRAVVGVGVLCGLLIAAVHESTRPAILRNRTRMLDAAVRDVLPGSVATRAFHLGGDGSFSPAPPDTRAGDLVHAGYDRDRRLVGLALVARGMGYQDAVEVVYGYSPDARKVIGFRVLESRETPGLGDRIESDRVFLRNFDGLAVRAGPGGNWPPLPFEFVKTGGKTADWQIEGITGATVSSRAVADMISRSIARWIPLVHARRDDFRMPNDDQ